MEKQELFRIGEIARMFSISVGSLRHYEKLGLIRPEYTDPDSGYRYYGVQQFERLNTIRYLRAIEQITRPVHISVNIIPQPVSIQIPSALTHIIIPDL